MVLSFQENRKIQVRKQSTFHFFMKIISFLSVIRIKQDGCDYVNYTKFSSLGAKLPLKTNRVNRDESLFLV